MAAVREGAARRRAFVLLRTATPEQRYVRATPWYAPPMGVPTDGRRAPTTDGHAPPDGRHGPTTDGGMAPPPMMPPQQQAAPMPEPPPLVLPRVAAAARAENDDEPPPPGDDVDEGAKSPPPEFFDDPLPCEVAYGVEEEKKGEKRHC